MNDYQEFKERELAKLQEYFASIDVDELTTMLEGMTAQEFDNWYYGRFCYSFPIPDIDWSNPMPNGLRQVLREIADIKYDMAKRFENSIPVFSEQLIQNEDWRSKQLDIKAQEAEERFMTVDVDGVQYRAKEAINVLWSGWDCDSTAWLVEVDGKNKLVVTNHGEHHFAEPSWLEARIKEYKQVLEESESLLKELT